MDEQTKNALHEVIQNATIYLHMMKDELDDCEEVTSLDNALNIVAGMLIADEAESFLLTIGAEGGTI